MSYDWQMDLRPRSRTATTFLPPATVEETAWDILLALHSDDRCELPLGKLAQLASVSQPVLNTWLGLLEQRELVTGVVNEVTREVRAVLTPSGRTLLDRYLSSTNGLQVGVRH
jgi:DNA-binding MarR family transcriptional regulator